MFVLKRNDDLGSERRHTLSRFSRASRRHGLSSTEIQPEFRHTSSPARLRNSRQKLSLCSEVSPTVTTTTTTVTMTTTTTPMTTSTTHYLSPKLSPPNFLEKKLLRHFETFSLTEAKIMVVSVQCGLKTDYLN